MTLGALRRLACQPISCLLLLITITAVPCYSGSPALIDKSSESVTAYVGTCVEIKCKVNGYLAEEDALWFWMKDGTWVESISQYSGTIVYSNKPTERPISSQFEGRVTYAGSTRLGNNSPSCSVSICDLREQDSGQYFFRYIPKDTTQRWSTINKANLIVTVNPCPITFNNPEDAQERKYVTLSCSTSSSCSSHLRIESVPSSLKNLHTYQKRASYSATASFRASWADDGREFTCQTRENTDPQLVKKISISVQYGPRVIATVYPLSPHVQGQRLTFTCNVLQSNPPTVTFTWFKNNQSLSMETAQIYSKTLQPEDSGSYSCSAQNSVSTAQSEALHILVQYKPRNTFIQTVDGVTEVGAGRSVTLKCVTDAKPNPQTYKWFISTRNLETTYGNNLELRNVQKANEGCYKCRATNSIGEGDYSREFCIKVIDPPSNLVLSMDTEVTEGQSVFISCTVQSSPAAALTLSRTSHSSTEELKKTTASNSLTHTFTVSSNHSGQYTCSAQNIAKTIREGKSLTVKYGPKQVRVEADPGLTVTENMTLTLRCRAQSEPPVSSVSWSRVTAGQEQHVHNGTVYTVKSVSVSDSGHYSCTAHNSISQRTSPQAEVQVRHGPKQVLVLSSEEQGPDGSRSVTLSCISHSFPPVSLYSWYKRIEGQQDEKVSENMNFTVKSTEPGVYYCTAKNEVSERTSEPVSLFQQGSFMKFIFVVLLLLLIVLFAFVVYRFKIKKSPKEGQQNSSRNATENSQAEARRNIQQGSNLTTSTSNASALYSTIHFTKQDRPGPSKQNSDDASLYYASLHFNKTKQTMTPKPREEEVVYSTVKNHDENTGDVYENFTKAKEKNGPNLSDSSDDDELEACYSQVNFKNKARNRSSADEDYSLLTFGNT